MLRLPIPRSILFSLCALALAAAGAPVALASAGGASVSKTAKSKVPAGAASGGAGVGAPPPGVSTPTQPIVVGFTAKIINGMAYAPSYAPLAVKEAIWAGNKIRHKPYIWGGGHGSFNDGGYDCSGSVSFVLHAAGLLKAPLDSSDFMNWGQRGIGRWITVYTNPGHAFVEIAGIRFDTSAEADPHPAPGSGPRWRPLFAHPSGFMARHPVGF